MWFAPEANVVTTVSGGAVGDRIVLHGEDEDGSVRRWSFNDIRPDSFVWRGERSSDQGTTWRLEAEYHDATRLSASLVAELLVRTLGSCGANQSASG